MARADSRRRANPGLAAVALLAFVSPPSFAVLCNVPSASQPTVGAAVRDLTCTTIQLAAGTYAENVAVARTLAIEGAGSGLSIVSGSFEATGAASDVTLARLAIDGTAAGVAGCWSSLMGAIGGATLASDDDVVVSNSGLASGPCRIFVDGFESAGTLAWSARFP